MDVVAIMWHLRNVGCLDRLLGVPDEERGLIMSCQGQCGAYSMSWSCADGPWSNP